MIGALFHNYNYCLYDRSNGVLDLRKSMRIEIERNVVPIGEVEFVLAMPAWMQQRKELIIHESPQIGPGAWAVTIDANSRVGRNGLYTYQLLGAYLDFKGDELIDSWRTFVGNAPPGSRVHFTWVVNKWEPDPSGYDATKYFRSLAEYGSWIARTGRNYMFLAEHGSVPADQIEFVLENKSQGRRDAIIYEAPTVGPGTWRLSTSPGQTVDRNGLYMYQVRGASLLVIESRPWMPPRATDFRSLDVIDLSDAIPGVRYLLKWW